MSNRSIVEHYSIRVTSPSCVFGGLATLGPTDDLMFGRRSAPPRHDAVNSWHHDCQPREGRCLKTRSTLLGILASRRERSHGGGREGARRRLWVFLWMTNDGRAPAPGAAWERMIQWRVGGSSRTENRLEARATALEKTLPPNMALLSSIAINRASSMPTIPSLTVLWPPPHMWTERAANGLSAKARGCARASMKEQEPRLRFEEPQKADRCPCEVRTGKGRYANSLGKRRTGRPRAAGPDARRRRCLAPPTLQPRAQRSGQDGREGATARQRGDPVAGGLFAACRSRRDGIRERLRRSDVVSKPYPRLRQPVCAVSRPSRRPHRSVADTSTRSSSRRATSSLSATMRATLHPRIGGAHWAQLSTQRSPSPRLCDDPNGHEGTR